jgi:hypothetical protein
MPQRIIFVPAILVILLAAVSSSARTTLAAESCAGRPGSTAPQGEHWYYRLDRTLHRPCWYLGPEGAKVARAGSPRIRSAQRMTGPRPTELATAEPSAEAMKAYAASAPVATRRNGIMLGESDADPSFTTRWPDRPGPSDAAYALASTSDDDAPRPASVDGWAELSANQPVPVLSGRAVAGMAHEAPIELVRMLALIGGALAFAVLIFWSAFSRPAARVIARSKSRQQQRSSAAAFRSRANQAGTARSPGTTRRSAGAMLRNDIAGRSVHRDDPGHGFAAAWILQQASRDR